MNRYTRTPILGLLALACAEQPTTITDEHDGSSSETDSSETDSSETETDTDSSGDTDTESSETDTETDTGEDPECGNGVVEADEQCDDGRHNGPGQYCNASCEDNICGDGDPGPNEACDDGNGIDDDSCTNQCALGTCGNGILDDAEECEDGNMDPSDGCTNVCLFATCGDGAIWVGYEQCDDGNSSNEDECTNACLLAACGDGFVQSNEACEDGNDVSNDGCFACQHQRVHAVTAGGNHTCAVLDEGAVRCWGSGDYGALGYGDVATIGDDEHPSTAGDVDVGGTAVAVSAGSNHTCALLDTGAVRCWGDNFYGQLGLGHQEAIGDDEVPSTGGDVDVGGLVVQVEAGGHRTCALLDNGAVRCWGQYGALGYASGGHVGVSTVPADAGDVALGGPVTQITVNHDHACALLGNGDVRCWGFGLYGRLGYGNTSNVGGSDDNLPANVGPVALGGSAIKVSAGGRHTCALMEGGTLRCWGSGADGQLGYGNHTTIGDNEQPIVAGEVDVGEVVVDVATGFRHTCALLDTNAVRCWGLGVGGQLGYGNTADIGDDEVPASVGDLELGGLVDLVASKYSHGCAILSTGALRCWGQDLDGKLGLGYDPGPVGDNELPIAVGYVQVY